MNHSFTRFYVGSTLLAALFTAIFLTSAPQAQAQVADAITTTNAVGDWFDTTNWIGGNVPDTTSIGTTDVIVNGGSNISLSTGNGSIYQSLRVGAQLDGTNNASDGTLTIDGGTLITHTGAGADLTTSNSIGGKGSTGQIIVNDSNSYLEFRGSDTDIGVNYPAGGGARNGTLILNEGTVFFNSDTSGQNNVDLGTGNAREGMITMTGGLMSFNSDTRLRIGQGGGNSGLGSFGISGGALMMDTLGSRNGRDILVNNNAATGIFDISGSAFVESGDDVIIGSAANTADRTALLTMSGGTLSTEDILIGNSNDNSGGTVEFSGGEMIVSGNVNVGSAGSINGGTSVWNQSGGTAVVDQNFQIGVNGTTGVVNLTGGLIRTGVDEDGPGAGNRVVRIGYGNQNAIDTINPNDAPSMGTLNISGGILHFDEQFDNNTNDINIGQANNNQGSGFGHVSVSGNGILSMNMVTPTANSAGDLRLGVGGNDALQTVNGRLNIADNAKVYVTRSLLIDDDADSSRNSVLDISGGSTMIGFDLRVGQNAIDSSVSTFTMSGGVVQTGVTTNTSDIIVSVNDAAVMNMSGGTLSTPDRFRVALNENSDGTANISGGFLNVADRIDMGIGSFSNSAINISGNAFIQAGTDDAALGGLVINSNGEGSSTVNLTMTGGILEIDLLDVQDGGSINSTHNFNGGIVRPLSSMDGGNGNIQLQANGVANQLTIAGTTFDLGGGEITDNDGTANQILISSGNVFNASLVDANIDQQGGLIDISQDDTQRATDLENNDLISSDGAIQLDIFATPDNMNAEMTTANSGIFDINNLQLDSTSILVAANGIDATTFMLGDTWDFLDFTTAGTISPTFTLPTLDDGLAWDTSNFGIDGTLVIIPEPAPTLLVFAAASLLFRRRTRRRD